MTLRDAGTELVALQTALAAEHAAIYGYAVVGAHLTGSELADATASYQDHRRRRDELTAMIRELGADPEPAAAAYKLPFRVESPADARRLAGRLEDGVAQAHAALVAASTRRPVRERGASALSDAAVAIARWTHTTSAFPGLSTPSAN